MPTPLQFSLTSEDGWPPVGSECISFERLVSGYKCLSVPLFIRDLSVDDVINVIEYKGGFVYSWAHVQRSKRSTVWLLRLTDNPPIHACLSELRSLRCNTTGLDDLGCYAIDVPASLPITDVDAVLEMLDENLVGVAFPSMRHTN